MKSLSPSGKAALRHFTGLYGDEDVYGSVVAGHSPLDSPLPPPGCNGRILQEDFIVA